jgi:hypothetical protein
MTTDSLPLPRRSLAMTGWPVLRAALGYASLAAMSAMMLYLALAAASGPSFLVPEGTRLPHWIAGVFAGSGVTMTGRTFVAVLAVLCAGYAVALACRRGISSRVVVGAIVVTHAFALLAPPLLSADVFSYIAYARMGVVHHVNPYVHGPIAIAGDPVIPFTNWLTSRSVYGPVFTLASYALAPLGLAATLWGLKAAAALASLGCVALVWRISVRAGRDPLPAAMLVGLNPVMLIYGVGGGHNDLIMLFFGLLAVAGTMAGRERGAGVALVASVAVKATTGILAPFMFIASLRRRDLLVGIVAGVVVVAAVAVAVFGGHAFGFIAQLEQHQSLSSTLSWPNTLKGLFGASLPTNLLGRIVLIGGFLYLLWRTWRGYDWISAIGWTLLLLAITSPWLLAWYVLWPLPFAALSRDRRVLAGTLLAQALFLSHSLPALAR